jgi:hypothetical protein
MTRPTTARAAVLVAALTVVSAGALAQQKTALPPPPTPAPGAESAAVAEFRKHCEAYVSLHKKIEGGLPKLPQEASPEQIDQGQQALSKGITAARTQARPGDIFAPGVADYLRQTLLQVFKTADGKQLRASILDENPVGAAVSINGPYPDSIPLSTMPPQILNALPKLPDELEYRFIGERLILFDHHAHIIVDYVDRALPRV